MQKECDARIVGVECLKYAAKHHGRVPYSLDELTNIPHRAGFKLLYQGFLTTNKQPRQTPLFKDTTAPNGYSIVVYLDGRVDTVKEK